MCPRRVRPELGRVLSKEKPLVLPAAALMGSGLHGVPEPALPGLGAPEATSEFSICLSSIRAGVE